jgi:hypothetical protein
VTEEPGMGAGWKVSIETSDATTEEWYVAIADAVEATTTASKLARAKATLSAELSEQQITELGLKPGQIRRA